MVQYGKNIYTTATGDGNRYEKARAFAKDGILLITSVFALKGATSVGEIKDADDMKVVLAELEHTPLSDLKNDIPALKRLGIFGVDDALKLLTGKTNDEAYQYLKSALTGYDKAQLQDVTKVIDKVYDEVQTPLGKNDVVEILSRLDGNVEEDVDDVAEGVVKWIKVREYSDFTPPKVYINERGQVTNGIYIIDETGMLPHLAGGSAGKSRFDFDIDANKAVLDAAAYANTYDLWKPSSGNPNDFADKAKVFVTNGPVGRNSDGEWTDYINVYRTKTGYIHGCPGNP